MAVTRSLCQRINRRTFCTSLALFSVSLGFSGCSLFKSSKKQDKKNEDFEMDEEEDLDSSEHSVFDKEREKQSELSDFIADNGRKSKEKRKVDPGDTFLLSSKAKEIYANTER